MIDCPRRTVITEAFPSVLDIAEASPRVSTKHRSMPSQYGEVFALGSREVRRRGGPDRQPERGILP